MDFTIMFILMLNVKWNGVKPMERYLYMYLLLCTCVTVVGCQSKAFSDVN